MSRIKQKKMKTRDQFIINFRGEMIGTINNNSSPEELFQNQTLRPILKLQNDLFIDVFKNYIIQSKCDFSNFKTEKKLQFIENSIQKDIKFRNILKGIVIGLFSIEEYNIFSQNSSSINKRMFTMLVERLKSQIQLF